MPGQEQQGSQAEEDVELKDVVSQTLESRGILSKINAQIRAAVFLALEDEAAQRNKLPVINQDLKAASTTRDGALMLSLIHDFLRAYELEFTMSVFAPEAGTSQQQIEQSRAALLRQLGIPDSQTDKRQPVLLEMIKRFSTAGNSEGANESGPPPPSKSSTEKVSSSISTLKDAPPLFSSLSTRGSQPSVAASHTEGVKQQSSAATASTNKMQSETRATSAKTKANELADDDADESTPEYKDDFDSSARSDSASSPRRATAGRARGAERTSEVDEDESIEVGEDERSRSSTGVRDRDESSLANESTISSDRLIGLDYVEDVVSQH